MYVMLTSIHHVEHTCSVLNLMSQNEISLLLFDVDEHFRCFRNQMCSDHALFKVLHQISVHSGDGR
jgi:hypothetical protein